MVRRRGIQRRDSFQNELGLTWVSCSLTDLINQETVPNVLATSSTTSELSSASPTVSPNALTTSSAASSSSVLDVAITPSSSNSAASSSSSTSAAAGANGASATASPSSHSKGLSSGAKAGIGIGVAIGVICLVVLSFLLGQRFSRRRSHLARARADAASTNEKDVFQAGRPYEMSGSQAASPSLGPGKALAYSMNTTTLGSGSDSVDGRSYDMPTSPPMNIHHDNSELSALPPVNNDDDQMYVGVPSHMSGSKRWSMKEFMK